MVPVRLLPVLIGVSEADSVDKVEVLGDTMEGEPEIEINVPVAVSVTVPVVVSTAEALVD